MYPYTSQEKDHQFVTSGRFSGPQHHMHYSGKYCFHMSTCNADSSYTVSTHKLFIKRVFHCVLRLLEGQFLKTKNRNLLDRQLQVPHHSQHNPEASSKRSCFPLGYAAKLAYLVSQVTTFFFLHCNKGLTCSAASFLALYVSRCSCSSKTLNFSVSSKSQDISCQIRNNIDPGHHF